MGDAINSQIAEAVETKESQQGERNDLLPDNVRKSSGGNDTTYTLRRLARDAPELLDRIEAGELDRWRKLAAIPDVEREAGGLLAKMELAGGDRKSKSHDVTLKLEDIGITKMQSSRWQMAAMYIEGEGLDVERKVVRNLTTLSTQSTFFATRLASLSRSRILLIQEPATTSNRIL